MTTKPEWDRLADILEKMPLGQCDEQTAAELRRLGHENEALRAMSFDTKRDIETAALLRKQEELLRQALGALEKIDDAMPFPVAKQTITAIRNHLEAK